MCQPHGCVHDTDPEVKANAKDLSVKAKDINLKAKAKDMLYCPRGQGHGLKDSSTDSIVGTLGV